MRKAIVCAFILLVPVARADAADFIDIQLNAATVAVVFETGVPVSGALYCFTLRNGSDSMGPPLIDGIYSRACAFDFEALTSGQFTYSVARPGSLSGFVTATATRNGQQVALRSWQVSQPPPNPGRVLRVRASLWDGAQYGPYEPQSGVTLPATAQVPLGGLVTLQAIDQSGVPITSSFTLGAPSVAPDVEVGALFAGSVLHPFIATQPSDGIFQAVHKGSVVLTIAPSDTAITPGTLTLTVQNPLNFGTDGATLDADISEVAHRTGVPPHFIKAHVERESFPKWNRSTFRYEPIGPTFGDLSFVSRAANARVLQPYTAYRLATQQDSQNGALAQGSLLIPSDRDSRASLRTGCDSAGNNGSPIGTGTTPVNPSAWEIFRCNDSTGARMNWSRAAGRFANSRAQRLRNDPFTAQTGLAASYGLLQIMYGRAVANKWQTSNGAQNPGLLFDGPGSVQSGEGSLLLGARIIAQDVRQANRRKGVQMPGHPGGLLPLFLDAWQLYNPGETDYGATIALRSAAFNPVAGAPVLGP